MAVRRLTKELKRFEKSPPAGIHRVLKGKNLFEWQVVVMGSCEYCRKCPQKTTRNCYCHFLPYAGRSVVFDVNFPHDYPFKAPKITLVDKTFFSPFVNTNGELCACSWQDKWSPALNAIQLIQGWIVSALFEPVDFIRYPNGKLILQSTLQKSLALADNHSFLQQASYFCFIFETISKKKLQQHVFKSISSFIDLIDLFALVKSPRAKLVFAHRARSSQSRGSRKLTRNSAGEDKPCEALRSHDRPISFRVKRLSGITTLFMMDRETKISALKDIIEGKMKTSPRASYQRLVYAGIQLEDDRTLASYGISDGTTIHLVMRLQSGMEGYSLKQCVLRPDAAIMIRKDWHEFMRHARK